MPSGGEEVYLYSFYNLGARWGFTPGKAPGPIVEEAVCAAGSVWTGEANLAPHRDSIPGPSSP